MSNKISFDLFKKLPCSTELRELTVNIVGKMNVVSVPVKLATAPPNGTGIGIVVGSILAFLGSSRRRAPRAVVVGSIGTIRGSCRRSAPVSGRLIYHGYRIR